MPAGLMKDQMRLATVASIAILLAAGAASADPPPAAKAAAVPPVAAIRTDWPVTPEQCKKLPPDKAAEVLGNILAVPYTPGEQYKDEPLPKLRDWTNATRLEVAVARQCIPPADAWKIIHPRGTWVGAASEADVERRYGDAERWAAALDAQIDDMQTCLQTPGCMAARKAAEVKAVLDGVCALLAQRAQDVRDMVREKSNPAGVVDKYLLHRIGLDIQAVDDALVDAKANYAASARRPFAPSLCR